MINWQKMYDESTVVSADVVLRVQPENKVNQDTKVQLYSSPEVYHYPIDDENYFLVGHKMDTDEWTVVPIFNGEPGSMLVTESLEAAEHAISMII